MDAPPQRARPTILFTTERSAVRDAYFPAPVLRRLEEIGEVRYHDGTVPLTPEELRGLLPAVDICLTHWGCPRFTEDVLRDADRLRMIAHAAGSVADLVTPAVYDRRILVTSVNDVMAEHVAEGVLSYILTDLHRLPGRARLMREGGWLDPADRLTPALRGSTIGLIGFGAVGRHLLALLRPFHVTALVHDPHVADAEVVAHGGRAASLDELLQRADVVSLHASMTPETRGLLDAGRLARMREGTLLVNTARSGLVDPNALRTELSAGRLRAVLDVFDQEPLAEDDPLRRLPNATLFPHTAGSSCGPDLADRAVDEIAAFVADLDPAYPVPQERFGMMTRETD